MGLRLEDVILGWDPSQPAMFRVGLGHRVSRGPMCRPQPQHVVIKQSFISLLVSASDEDCEPSFPLSNGHSTSPARGVFGFLPWGRSAGRTGRERPGRGFQASCPINPTPAKGVLDL